MVRARCKGRGGVTSLPQNCQTGAPLPIPSFSALDSYARGGTLTEVVNAAAFLPGQVTPGLGVWSHTQANAYKAVWEVFILFDTPPAVPGFPFKRGVQRLMRDIEVHGDQMTFNGSSQVFDTNGNVLAVACAGGTGTDVGGEDELSICDVACGDTNKSVGGRAKRSAVLQRRVSAHHKYS